MSRMPTMNRMAPMCLAVIALIVAWTHPASAGRTDTSPVNFFFFLLEGSAAGSFGSTRNVSPSTDYLSCESRYDGTNSFYGSCAARNGSTTAQCAFPQDAQVTYQTVHATVRSDSYLIFSWDTTSWDDTVQMPVCDSLYVYTDSYDEPKLP